MFLFCTPWLGCVRYIPLCCASKRQLDICGLTLCRVEMLWKRPKGPFQKGGQNHRNNTPVPGAICGEERKRQRAAGLHNWKKKERLCHELCARSLFRGKERNIFFFFFFASRDHLLAAAVRLMTAWIIWCWDLCSVTYISLCACYLFIYFCICYLVFTCSVCCPLGLYPWRCSTAGVGPNQWSSHA